MSALLRLKRSAQVDRLEDTGKLFSLGGVEQWGGNFERITEPTRIGELIASLVRYESSGVAHSAHRNLPVRVTGCAQSMQVMTWTVSDGVVPLPSSVEVTGFNSVFHLPIESGFQVGGRLVTPFPETIYVGRRRWQRRAAVVSPIRALVSKDAGLAVEGFVRDISYDGLAIVVDGGSAVPGGEMVLRLVDGDDIVPLVGRVRSVVPDLEAGALAVRLRVTSVADRARWIALVNRQLHPETSIGSRWSDATWSLYERCGYFTLSGKRPEDFSRRRRAFEEVSRQLDEAPHIGVQACWPSRDGTQVVATASALKVYSGTWLGLQMAKDSGDAPDGTSGRRILRELNYRMKEHMQLDPQFRWFCTYIQAKKVWTRFVFHDGMQRFADGGEAAFVRFHAFEAASDGRYGAGAPLTVGLATAAERDRLADVLSQTRPRSYLEAFDLVPERLDLGSNVASWRSAGFARDRDILVARAGGRPIAAAVIEQAADGLHLFGLLDLVRVYPLAAGADLAAASLLDAAAAWFRRRAKERFCVFVEQDVALPVTTIAQLTDLGEADACILSARRVPELLELIYELTAPRSANAL
jgi:hypothetical protein